MSETTKIDLVNLAGSPGTQFTKVSALQNWRENFNGSTGVISGIAIRSPSETGDGRDILTDYDSAFPGVWNGIYRHSVTAKAMSNGNILLVAKYKNQKPGSGRWSDPPRLLISHGDASVKVYNSLNNIEELYRGDIKGRYVYARIITVKWNLDTDRTPRTSMPPEGLRRGLNLNGTLNKNTVHPGGLSFAPLTLRYTGPEVKYQNGSWDYMHVAKARIYYPVVPSIMNVDAGETYGKKSGNAKYWEESYIDDAGKPDFRQIIPAATW